MPDPRMDADLAAARRRVQGIVRRTRQPESAFKQVATVVRNAVDKQFATQGAFFGHTWTPLKPSTRREKLRAGYGTRIETRSGALRKSFTRRDEQLYEYEGHAAKIGSHSRIAVFQQYGTHSHKTGKQIVPKRPLLIVTKELKAQIRDVFDKHVSGRKR